MWTRHSCAGTLFLRFCFENHVGRTPGALGSHTHSYTERQNNRISSSHWTVILKGGGLVQIPKGMLLAEKSPRRLEQWTQNFSPHLPSPLHKAGPSDFISTSVSNQNPEMLYWCAWPPRHFSSSPCRQIPQSEILTQQESKFQQKINN